MYFCPFLGARDRPLVAESCRLQDGPNDSESEEMRLLVACQKCRNPSLLPIVKLAIETAMRQSELVGMRWRHIDLQRRTVFLPLTKNGDSRTVPLSTAAVDVLPPCPTALKIMYFRGSRLLYCANLRKSHIALNGISRKLRPELEP